MDIQTTESRGMAGLLKTQRLLSKKDFETVLDGSGLKIVCRDFVLIASNAVADRPARLGLIISGKVGNSVIRNRVKRSVREVFRNEFASSAVLTGRDLVVIGRPTLVDKDGRVKPDVQDSLKHCAGRLFKRLIETGSKVSGDQR